MARDALQPLRLRVACDRGKVIDAKLRPRSARTVRFGQVDDDRAPIPDSAQGLPAVGSSLWQRAAQSFR
jgi:hypothetical protein